MAATSHEGDLPSLRRQAANAERQAYEGKCDTERRLVQLARMLHRLGEVRLRPGSRDGLVDWFGEPLSDSDIRDLHEVLELLRETVADAPDDFDRIREELKDWQEADDERRLAEDKLAKVEAELAEVKAERDDARARIDEQIVAHRETMMDVAVRTLAETPKRKPRNRPK